MSKGCFSVFPLVTEIPGDILLSMRTVNFVFASMNIIGNAFLIHALRVTGQTKSISIKFIISLSVSGLINGLFSFFVISLLLWEEFQDNCVLKLVSQVVIGSTNPFSCAMITVIALDRFFHMKYLLRYSGIMNNRRGYRLIFACFCFTFVFIATQLIALFMTREYMLAIQAFCSLFLILLVGSVAALYYKAYRSLLLRPSSQMSVIVNNSLRESKNFAKTAKRIIISLGLLSSPVAVSLELRVANSNNRFVDPITLDILLWFSLVLYSANFFSNSVIFISHNRPAKELLKRWITRGRSHVGIASNS